MVDAVAGKLLGSRSAEDEITLKTSIHNLYNDLLVGETDDKAVFRGIVLVFGLGDQTLASIV